ncbi:MAG: S-layer homology domain-containing protein, partial [Acetanaerobacterium sp.]
ANDGTADSTDTYTITLTINPATIAPTITTTSLDEGVVGTAYSQLLAATGDTPITWSIDSGDLPDGLTLDPDTGVISGTPTADGTFTLTVMAENSEGDDTKALSIEINPAAPPGTAPAITTNSLDDGVVGAFYNDTLAATGETPITWTIFDGSLPNGLSLSGNTISGKPGTKGSFTFTVKAENSVGSTTKQLKIVIRAASSGGDGSTGGSSGDNSATPPIVPDKKPDQPVIAGTTVSAIIGSSGLYTAAIPDYAIANAISAAQTQASQQNRTANGISVAINVETPSTANTFGIVLTQPTLQRLISAQTRSLEVNGSLVSLDFDLQALQEIQRQSKGDVTITLTSVHSLSSAAQALIGARPVYNVAIASVKEGKTVAITSLIKGRVTLSLPYTPHKNEAVGYLFGVYVDGNGKATRIPGSAYDTNSKSILFDSNHFSVYGVGYTEPSADFMDISTHWARNSIDYVVGRGLFGEISDTTFSPDTAMNRGMLVTVLGRLAGADVSGYKISSFTDITADSSFLPYIEWAYKKGIVSGIGNQQFAADQAVTREELAAILQNYAKATGYTLPVTREAVTFADSINIGSGFRDAVKAMQQAGIMNGKKNGYFEPQGVATRSEVAVMLHRYIMLTISSDTALGWAKNDDGQLMYYKDGRALTGWQKLDGKVYCFEPDGAYTKGWKQDGKGNWYYFWTDGALVGWWDIGSETSKKHYYFTADAIMVSGKWLEIDGKWYYFYDDGALAVSTKIGDCEVDENGVRITK